MNWSLETELEIEFGNVNIVEYFSPTKASDTEIKCKNEQKILFVFEIFPNTSEIP